MDKSWDFLFELEKQETDVFHRAIDAWKAYPNNLNSNNCSPASFIERLLSETNKVVADPNVSMTDVLRLGMTIKVNNKTIKPDSIKLKSDEITNISYVDFLNHIIGSQYDSSYKFIKSEDLITAEGEVIKILFLTYLNQMTDDERKDFSNKYKFISSDLKDLQDEVITRLNINIDSEFKQKSLNLLADDLANKILHGIDCKYPSIKMSIHVKHQRKRNNFNASAEISVGSVEIPICVIASIIYLRRLHDREYSNLDIRLYLDDLLRQNKHYNFLALLIIWQLVKDNIKCEQEKKYFLEYLKNNNKYNLTTGIPDRIFRQIQKYKEEILHFLFNRILTDAAPIDKFLLANRKSKNKKVYFFDYLFPYTDVNNNTFFSPSDDSFVNIVNSLYICFKGFEFTKLIKEFNPNEHYDMVCYLEDNSKIASYIKFIDKEKQYIIKDDIEYTQLISQIQYINDQINTKRDELELKFISDMFKENEKVKLLELKFQSINHTIHRLRHEIAPTMGFLKSRMCKLEVDEERRSKYILMFDDIMQGIDDVTTVIDDYTNLEIINEPVDILNLVYSLPNENIYENIDFGYVVQGNKEGLVIRANSELKKSVFDNILTNAIRHGFGNKQADRKIKITIESDEKHIIVSVANNGTPFSGLADRVFDYKVCFGPTANTGEGLYLVKNYMLMIGGDVEFISKPEAEYSVTIKLTFKRF